jgi:hypothetical protein
MNDQELADRIVALGVGFKREFTKGPRYTLTKNRDYLDAPSWVRDWRVAGALMEKAQSRGIEIIILNDGVQIAHPKWAGYEWSDNKSLPRAICEACVEALKQP